MRGTLASASDAAWALAAALSAAAAFRLASVAFQFVSTAPSPPAEQVTEPPRRTPAATPSRGPAPALTGKAVRTTLAVTVGPARADVYVNGQVVGRTPFFGDVSCKDGAPLRVQVVPEKAALLSFERTCRRGLLRIERPDGEDPLRAPE